jgi:hypothetical protein
VVCTNGSFEHFSQPERQRAFHQEDLSVIPDGRPLRAFASREDAKYFRPHNDVVDATYGSLFVVFDRH